MADRVIRCVLWACRNTCVAESDSVVAENAVSSGWGWFRPDWESGFSWRCPLHLTGNEETERAPATSLGHE